MTWLKSSFPECIPRNLPGLSKSIPASEAFLEFQIDNRQFVSQYQLYHPVIA